jgi:protein arginine kinase activator
MELLSSNRVPSRVAGTKKSAPIHLGRAPGQTMAINPSSRLLALNEALKETLQREDYEQAAWLRDQIRALTENERKTNDQPE